MIRRQILFNQGVAAVSATFPGAIGIYVCPICRRGFLQSDLDNRELSYEHVPPRASGGRPILLTCKGCNNFAGHAIDVHADSRAKALRFAKTFFEKAPGSVGRAIADWGGQKLNIDISVEENGVTTLHVVGDVNNPASVKTAVEHMKKLAEEGRADGYTFNITSRVSYHQRLARVSDLRAAFLACTAKFGYRYAFSPTLEQISKQIARPEEEIVDRWWLANNPLPSSPGIAVSASGGVAIAAFADVCVALPWPTKRFVHYVEVVSRVTNGESVQFHDFQVLDWPSDFEAILDHGRNAKD